MRWTDFGSRRARPTVNECAIVAVLPQPKVKILPQKFSVQVRLSGKTEAEVRAAAKTMNVAVKFVKAARGGHFYFLYGFKTIEE